MTRIYMNHGKTLDWKSLKKTVYFLHVIAEMCQAFSEKSIHSTLLEEIGKFTKDDFTVQGTLYALDKIVDLDGIEAKNRFVVKENLDTELDEKREKLTEMIENQLNLGLDDCLGRLTSRPNAFMYKHFPETGFVIATGLKAEELDLQMLADNGMELILTTVDALYIRTPNCHKLNNSYEKLLSEIIEKEMNIFKELVKYIKQNLPDLITLTNLCAKLDVLVSFASVSAKQNYVKPKITMNKELQIVNGRHPLVELIREYVPSTTEISQTNKNFVNIITAPNAAGKSVYIKHVALIAFLAHIGMFVPAESCTVPLLHSIYTRIYTPESIFQCESAFLADLQQMSKVITQSTSRSLVIVDEFGKGTSYKDGLALFSAAIEHFINRGVQSPIVLATTHFQKLHTMIDLKDIAKFKTIATRRNEEGVYESIFELAEGISEQSFATENPESKSIMKHIFDEK